VHSRLSLREIEEHTSAHASAKVTAARLCLYKSGKVMLRDEQINAVEFSVGACSAGCGKTSALT